MGTLLDATVFIDLERAVRRLPLGRAMAEVSRRLEEQLGPDEEVGIAAITASELLHGVHRATPEHRARREAFVEAVLTAFPPLPFELLAARAHARIWAGLAAAGQDVGAHDRIVAATAISAGGVSPPPVSGTLTVSPASTSWLSPSPADRGVTTLAQIG